MKICKQCGAKIPDDAKKCPICGNKNLDEAIIKLCPSCGAINLSEASHCIKCGAQLREDKEVHQEEHIEAISEPKEEIAKVCPNCGYVNSLGNRFCNMCGQPMFVQHKQEEVKKEVAKPKMPVIVKDFVDDGGDDDFEEKGSRINRLLNGISVLFAIGFILSLFSKWFLRKSGLKMIFEVTSLLSKSNETIVGLGALGRVFLLLASVITIIGGVLAIVNTIRGEKASRFISIASIVLSLAFGISLLYFYQELMGSIGLMFYLGTLSNIIFGAIGLFTTEGYDDDEYDEDLEDEYEDL